MTDQYGTEIKNATVGEMFVINATVSNMDNESINGYVFMELFDENSTVIDLAFTTVSIGANDKASAGQSFTVELPGTYIAKVFYWSDWASKGGSILATEKEIHVKVN